MTYLDALGQWMPKQRWFNSADRSATVRLRGEWVIAEGADLVEIDLIEAGSTTYVVPLLVTDEERDGDLIGRDGPAFVYDATSLEDGHRALLAVAASTRIIEGGGECLELTGQIETELGPVSSSARLTGEQSNTSIQYLLEDGQRVILKVFRILNAGLNPDVILTSALAEAGSPYVAPPRGSALGTWRSGSATESGHVLVAQEFMVGARDAWQVMTEAGAQGPLGDDLAERISDLGRMTRAIHEDLADRLPTEPAGPATRSRALDSWRARAERAMADAPVLRSHGDEIAAVFEAAERADPWPDMQRIHGDYHLGQVLDVPERGWIALDFEGEPLRPLSERTEPDLALRDVAGMLRSFDYVGGDLERRGVAPEDARAWSQAARTAFLSGYGELPGGAELLAALELDKALYEVSYETAQRPDWVDVPLTGTLALLTGN